MTGSTLLTVTPLNACDVIQSGIYSVADVQRIIDEALGALPAVNDLNGDGKASVVEIQIVLNAVLGMGCTLSSNMPVNGEVYGPVERPRVEFDRMLDAARIHKRHPASLHESQNVTFRFLFA